MSARKCGRCGSPLEGRQWCPACLEPAAPLSAEAAVEVLLAGHDALAAAIERDELLPRPEVLLLAAETGRGKTYAAQRFFDRLAERRDGLWTPHLAPRWPPADPTKLHRDRKRVVPATQRWGQAPQFLWVGINGDAPGTTGCASMVAQLASQVHAAAAALPGEQKRETERAVLRLLADVGLDVLEDLTHLSLPHTIAKRLVATRRKVGSIYDVPAGERHLLDLGNALVLAVGELRRLGVMPVCVVVLDDAHAVDESVLRLLSVLLRNDTELLGENLDATAVAAPSLDSPFERRPRLVATDQEPALPTLIIATAWPHSLAEADDSAFARWLGEARQCDCLTEVPISDMRADSAEGLLQRLALPAEAHAKVMEQMVGGTEWVVPLVLAESAARLEEKRDGLTGRIDVDAAYIASLPTDPEFHLRDRLRSLGELERGLLTRLAIWGDRPPALLPQVILTARGAADPTAKAGAAVSTLSAHLLVSSARRHPGGAELPLMFEQLALDHDVSRYLRKRAGPAARQDMHGVALLALEAAVETLKQELASGSVAVWGSVRQLLRPALQFVAIDELDGDLLMLTANLEGIRPPSLPPSATAFGRLLWYAYAPESELHAEAAEVIAAIEQQVCCRWSPSLARRLVTLGLPSDLLQRVVVAMEALATNTASRSPVVPIAQSAAYEAAGLLDRAAAALEPFTAHWQVALRLAGIYRTCGLLDDAERVLRPLAKSNDQAAVLLANLLESRGHDGEAERVLGGLAASHQTVTLRLAEFLERRGRFEDAERVLTARARSDEGVALRLIELLERRGKLDAAEELLVSLVGNERAASVALATRFARRRRILEVLPSIRRLATTEGAAALLLATLLEREGRIGEAERVLAPLVAQTAVAVALARLLERNDRLDDAERVLATHAETNLDVALALASIYKRRNRITDVERVLAPQAERSAPAALALSAIYEETDRLPQAVQVLAGLAPHDTHAALRLATVYESQHQPEQAERVLLGFAATDEHAALRLATLYRTSGRLDAAERVLTGLTAPPSQNVVIELASLYAATDRFDAAEGVLRGFSKTSRQVATELAELYATRGRVDDAAGVLEDHAAGSDQAAFALATLYREKTQSAGAEGALEARAGDPYADQERALLCVTLGDLDRAAEILAPHGALMNDIVQGAVSGLALLAGAPPPVHEPRSAVGAFSMVSNMARFLRTAPERQPEMWRQFFAARKLARQKGSKAVPAAARYVAQWMVAIARGAHPELEVAAAVRQSAATIWPEAPYRTVDFLNREILAFLKEDDPFLSRNPRSIRRVAALMAIGATLAVLEELYPKTIQGHPYLRNELVVRKVVAKCAQQPDLRGELEPCAAWSDLAGDVLRRTASQAHGEESIPPACGASAV